MKIEIEDGSCAMIPLPVCPGCFEKQMIEHSRAVKGTHNRKVKKLGLKL